ncbi:hypothetical protein C5167_022643 [Papaver somniferum]|uniref:FAR1 domain-containing protein n=1 Tax=Papaver somniferum TaxID=3469 RepID=A0A4Y7JLQ5_PAPSO|nr:hypothetical protein C5167_022643 [Papaver somniferum]
MPVKSMSGRECNNQWDLNLIPNEVVDQNCNNLDRCNDGQWELESEGSDDDEVKGTVFQSEEKMYEFYNQYARRVGFSICRGAVKRTKDDKIRKRVILCSKQGFKERHNKGTPPKARPDMHTGCMARIQCIAKGDQFVVTKFIQEHNHKLVDSTEGHLLRSQRKILPQQTTFMESLHSGGCGPTQIFGLQST